MGYQITSEDKYKTNEKELGQSELPILQKVPKNYILGVWVILKSFGTFLETGSSNSFFIGLYISTNSSIWNPT